MAFRILNLIISAKTLFSQAPEFLCVFLILLQVIFFPNWFLEREGKEGGRRREVWGRETWRCVIEKHPSQNWLPPTPTGHQIHNLGVFPDKESNLQPSQSSGQVQALEFWHGYFEWPSSNLYHIEQPLSSQVCFHEGTNSFLLQVWEMIILTTINSEMAVCIKQLSHA